MIGTMGNEGKERGAGANLTIHSNSVTYVGLTTSERARAPCIDRCHASIVWLNFTRESGARSTLELEHTRGWGRKWSRRFWFSVATMVAFVRRSGIAFMPGISVSKKRGVEPRRLNAQYTKAPSTFDLTCASSTRIEIPIQTRFH